MGAHPCGKLKTGSSHVEEQQRKAVLPEPHVFEVALLQ